MAVTVTFPVKQDKVRELPCLLKYKENTTSDVPLIVLFVHDTVGFCISGTPSQINKVHTDWTSYDDPCWVETTVTLSSEN
jgi:hypothetical protein